MSKQWKPGEQAPKSANYSCYDEEGRCGGSCYLEKVKDFQQHSIAEAITKWMNNLHIEKTLISKRLFN